MTVSVYRKQKVQDENKIQKTVLMNCSLGRFCLGMFSPTLL